MRARGTTWLGSLLKEAGLDTLDCIMSLEVKDVRFSYPARPHIKKREF